MDNYKNVNAANENINVKQVRDSEKIHAIDLMQQIENAIEEQIKLVKIYSDSGMKR